MRLYGYGQAAQMQKARLSPGFSNIQVALLNA